MQQTHEPYSGCGVRNEFDCESCSYSWLLCFPLQPLSRLTKIRYTQKKEFLCPSCITQREKDLNYRKLPHNLNNTVLWTTRYVKISDFSCDDCGDSPDKSWSASLIHFGMIPMRQYLHGKENRCFICFAGWVQKVTPWI